jgi:hypothetical protein
MPKKTDVVVKIEDISDEYWILCSKLGYTQRNLRVNPVC